MSQGQGDATLVLSAGSGYSIVNATPQTVAILLARGGEFMVRNGSGTITQAGGIIAPTTAAAATGPNAKVVDPRTPPITTGWVHMMVGDKQSFGDAQNDPIFQLDIFCIASGELGLRQH